MRVQRWLVQTRVHCCVNGIAWVKFRDGLIEVRGQGL